MSEIEIEIEEIENIIEEFKEKEPEIYNMYKDTEMLSDTDIYEIITSPTLNNLFGAK